MPRITLVAALFGRAAAQVGSHQTLAGYQSASSVDAHSKIDLDMEELEKLCGYHSATDGTQTTWRTDALFVYNSGGGGKCTQEDVDDTANGWCTAVDGAKGNSLKTAPKIRTLAGFATKDYSSLTGDYAEKLPPIYTAYWTANGMTATEAAVWADTFITKDYSAICKDSGTNQLIKKGANYQAVWMYVLHELEDAIGDCKAGDINANDGNPTGGAPHAWDEGWAFYAGSQVADTAAKAVTDDGTLIWELAEKRGSDFNTQDATGPAKVNVNLLAEFIAGRDLIIDAKCTEAEALIDKIITQMSIPLIQGTLKYAYSSDPASGSYCASDAGKNAMTASDDCVKAWAEGWAFAAGILPRINECSATAATTIKTNLDITATAPVKDGYAKVRDAMESTYTCLGITAADVGVYKGIPAPASDSATAPAVALGAAAAAAGAALLL